MTNLANIFSEHGFPHESTYRRRFLHRSRMSQAFLNLSTLRPQSFKSGPALCDRNDHFALECRSIHTGSRVAQERIGPPPPADATLIATASSTDVSHSLRFPNTTVDQPLPDMRAPFWPLNAWQDRCDHILRRAVRRNRQSVNDSNLSSAEGGRHKHRAPLCSRYRPDTSTIRNSSNARRPFPIFGHSRPRLSLVDQHQQGR